MTGRSALMGLGALALGLLGGGAAGTYSYHRLDDPRATCGTCHHGQTRLEERIAEAPHRTDLGVECHRCHVVPVKEYVDALSGELGLDSPGWAASITDPTVGGQTCLGCHVGRGRGSIECERCHVNGDLEPSLTEGCAACHPERPMHPHDQQECRVCHVETALDPKARTAGLMHQKLHQESP